MTGQKQSIDILTNQTWISSYAGEIDNIYMWHFIFGSYLISLRVQSQL